MLFSKECHQSISLQKDCDVVGNWTPPTLTEGSLEARRAAAGEVVRRLVVEAGDAGRVVEARVQIRVARAAVCNCRKQASLWKTHEKN